MLRTRSLAVLSGFTLVFVATGQMTQAPPLWLGLRPGPYHVGYRRIIQDGATVHMWYPTASDGHRLRFRDYLSDDGYELRSFLATARVSPTTIDSLFGSVLYALPSPAPIDSAFPLVLIAHGNGQDVADQVVLCEYLASQGLVVAAPPSPTTRTPLQREDQVGELAERQAAELAGTIALTATTLRVDAERLGVVGHSLGARAALLLAMRDRRVRGVVSLDGGIGTGTAIRPFRQAPSFRAEAPLPPLLHFYEELDAFMKPDFALLTSLHPATLTLQKTQDMHHVHFTTYGFAAAVFADIASVTHSMPGTARSVVGVAESTATFLRRNLR